LLEDKDPVPEHLRRSKFKELLPLEYGEQLEGYNQMKWYKVNNNKPDGGNFPIKYFHFQNVTLFHGSRLITFIADVNLLLSWGAHVDYGVKQKAKLMYHHKDLNAFAALIGSRFKIIRLFNILEVHKSFWILMNNADRNTMHLQTLSLLVITISDGNI
jgi:hypothetical protein